jgi:hypothetical protein
MFEQKKEWSFSALALHSHSVLVGERSEISNFLKEDVDTIKAWKDSPCINQKEREAERE